MPNCRAQIKEFRRVLVQYDNTTPREPMVCDKAKIAHCKLCDGLTQLEPAGIASSYRCGQRLRHCGISLIWMVAEGTGAPAWRATTSKASSVVTASGNPFFRRSAESSASISPGR
ncbi:hypothetical protein Y695_00387 [Hydrogenophaga sp. T4]|nr:hypothetical protein Y695_00387 [Hydrogenophaga sp. T4]